MDDYLLHYAPNRILCIPNVQKQFNPPLKSLPGDQADRQDAGVKLAGLALGNDLLNTTNSLGLKGLEI
jgi:hypothetical protein